MIIVVHDGVITVCQRLPRCMNFYGAFIFKLFVRYQNIIPMKKHTTVWNNSLQCKAFFFIKFVYGFFS